MCRLPTAMVTTFSDDIPKMWTKFRGDRQAPFAKTWDLFKDKIKQRRTRIWV